MAITGGAWSSRRKYEVGEVCKNRTSGRRHFCVQPSLTETICSRYSYFCLVILFAAKCHRPTTAQGNNFSFSLPRTSYNCSFNVICLGDVHDTGASEFAGLTLLRDDPFGLSVGIAYYHSPVRLKDPFTRQSASFNTSFQLDTVNLSPYHPDGVTFVITADNRTPRLPGSPGGALGIFDMDTQKTSFKSIVVEFDGFQNLEFNDISDNHVSFDFVNINWTAAANASDANVFLWDNKTLYAWVEYSSQTLSLEVRVSNDSARPMKPLLNYTADLFSMVEEYMWVGFSSGSGSIALNHIVGDWTFESYGISLSSPVPSSPVGSRARKVGFIVGIAVGVVALLLVCVFFCILIDRKCGEKASFSAFWRLLRFTNFTEEDHLIVQGMPERFSYNQLRVATRNFQKESKLGQGGFGSVYRGVLPSGVPIAVKKINAESTQGEREFMAEVSIISQLKHRNLIQLLGWCRDASRGEFLLVYELMPNGSLDKVLFGPFVGGTSRLSWPQRFDIVRSTAAAVEYLHQGWTQRVIHRDIKCANIMLDEKWNAKLGDFGLARLVDHEMTATTTIQIAGTRGYIAPELAIFGKFTDKSDVYAFGAVVLEIACGRKALVNNIPEDEMLLTDWVWQKLSEDDLLSIVDKGLQGYDSYLVEVMLRVGLLCSHHNPLARPTMRHIVQILAGDVPMPSILTAKPSMFCLNPQDISLEEENLQKSKAEPRSRSEWLVSTNYSEVIRADTRELFRNPTTSNSAGTSFTELTGSEVDTIK